MENLRPLTTIGQIIEVTPWDEIQFWPENGDPWIFIDDRTPFKFRVEGALESKGKFFGLYGKVISGPTRYLNLTASVMTRDVVNWSDSIECSATFKVAPTIVQPKTDYDAKAHDNISFFLHPEGTTVNGLPRISRFGGLKVVEAI